MCQCYRNIESGSQLEIDATLKRGDWREFKEGTVKKGEGRVTGSRKDGEACQGQQQ